MSLLPSAFPSRKQRRSSQFSPSVTNQGEHQLHDSLLLYDPWPHQRCPFSSPAKAWSLGWPWDICAAEDMPCTGTQRVFTSPAPAPGTAGWEEASVSAGFADPYQACSLVISTLDLKFFLGKQVVLPKLLQWRACTYPVVIASTDMLLSANL